MTSERDGVVEASYRNLSTDSLAALLAGTNPIEVHLEGNPIGDTGAAVLCDWPGLAHVQVLNLADTGIGMAGLASLSKSDARPFALSLDENPLYDEGIQLLVRSSFVERVRYLGLGCTGLDVTGVRALVESPFLNAVETLDLMQTELHEESWQILRARFPLVLGG